jgi:hypothetical protein
MAAFGVIVPPIVTGALFVAYGAPWQTVGGFYAAFLQGPSTALAAKFGYSLAVFPVLLATALPRVTIPTPAQPVAPAPTVPPPPAPASPTEPA